MPRIRNCTNCDRTHATVKTVMAACLSSSILIIGLAHPSPSFANDDCPYRRVFDDTCTTIRPFADRATSAPDDHPALWRGLYIGADAGGMLGNTSTSGVSTTNIDVNGFNGGAHVGFAMPLDNIYLGVEFDVAGSSADGDRVANGLQSLNAEIDWISSTRIRLGFTSGDFLYYATGGLAFAHQELQLETIGASQTDNEMLYGYAVGGGIEMKMTQNMSARLEAIHYGFSGQKFDVSNQPLNTKTDITTIRAGLSFHLN